MAHFIRIWDVPEALRKGPREAYRKLLRQGLLNPTLTTEKKSEIQDLLQNLDVKPPNPVPLAQTTETGQIVPASASWENLTKDALVDLALERGVKVVKSWPKARILEALQAESCC